MLTRLKLSQFALVDSLDLELEGGLCLLTGETGAGKSILVEALSLLGGQRAETEMIRTGKDEALVEGTFDFTVAGAISAQNEAVASLLAGWGIVFEGDLVVRRKLQRSGRNSATVNGAGVTLAQLKELGALLFAIHGQHESQVLLDEDAHRNFLDSLPELEGVARTVEEAWLRLHGAVEDLDALRRTSAEREARLALLRAQCEELGRIAPKTGEEGDLISERNRLQHAEQIAEDASAVADILRDSEASVAAMLAEVGRRIAGLAEVDPEWKAYKSDFVQAAGVLQAIAGEAERVASTIVYDPEALEKIESRLADLQRLKRKYGPDLEDVVSSWEELERELARLGERPMSVEEAQTQVDAAYREYLDHAKRLSELRKRGAQSLSISVEEALRPLALDKARFQVLLHPRPLDGPESASAHGLESVSFQFSANPGEPLKPLSRIASGGELSRTMLAVLSASNAAGGPDTLVFDEVDTGIGGRPAEAVGRHLHKLSQVRQVLCITHLPQIAAFASQHIRVEKSQEQDLTKIQTSCLSGERRVEELARMLAGETITDTARDHARELLKAAT
jgi:DNA repair protein RecN (Recombination protein N)